MKIQPTMQLHNSIDDYETTRRIMTQMAQIRDKIKTLQHYRDMGITTFQGLIFKNRSNIVFIDKIIASFMFLNILFTEKEVALRFSYLGFIMK